MDGDKGFTLLELMIVITIVGILTAISVPNVMKYQKRAELAALQAGMNVFMNAEDAYYTVNGKYFPVNGTINIPSGSMKNIPELGFTFQKGHKHRYYVYALSRSSGSVQYDYYFIIVYADGDYNNDGAKDILYYLTYIYNGQFLSNRQFYQF